jgi:hypothetical protein
VENRRPAEAVIRVNFRVALSVNPLLATELKRFTFGKSRHARLLTLAMVGLMCEAKSVNNVSSGPSPDGVDVRDPRVNDHGHTIRLTDNDFEQIGE